MTHDRDVYLHLLILSLVDSPCSFAFDLLVFACSLCIIPPFFLRVVCCILDQLFFWYIHIRIPLVYDYCLMNWILKKNLIRMHIDGSIRHIALRGEIHYMA